MTQETSGIDKGLLQLVIGIVTGLLVLCTAAVIVTVVLLVRKRKRIIIRRRTMMVNEQIILDENPVYFLAAQREVQEEHVHSRPEEVTQYTLPYAIVDIVTS